MSRINYVLKKVSVLPSVSFQTIPSRVTEVPGSRGPRQSGSVMVPISVPTLASTWKEIIKAISYSMIIIMMDCKKCADSAI